MNEDDDETTLTQLMMDQEPMLMPVQHSTSQFVDEHFQYAMDGEGTANGLFQTGNLSPMPWLNQVSSTPQYVASTSAGPMTLEMPRNVPMEACASHMMTTSEYMSVHANAGCVMKVPVLANTAHAWTGHMEPSQPADGQTNGLQPQLSGGQTSGLQSEHGAFHPGRTTQQITGQSHGIQSSSVATTMTVQPNQASREQSGQRKIMDRTTPEYREYRKNNNKACKASRQKKKEREKKKDEQRKRDLVIIKNQKSLASLMKNCNEMADKMKREEGATDADTRLAAIKHMEENMTTLYGFEPKEARYMIYRFTVDSLKEKKDIAPL